MESSPCQSPGADQSKTGFVLPGAADGDDVEMDVEMSEAEAAAASPPKLLPSNPASDVSCQPTEEVVNTQTAAAGLVGCESALLPSSPKSMSGRNNTSQYPIKGVYNYKRFNRSMPDYILLPFPIFFNPKSFSLI